MNTGLIPMRYATALFDYAKSNGEEKTLYGIAGVLLANMRKHDRIQTMLENPAISLDQKSDIIKKAAGTESNIVFNRFLELIFTNQREALLYRILTRYMSLYRTRYNIFSGKLITAAEIDSKTANDLTRIIEKRNQGVLEMEQIVQPDLIGGFVLEMNNIRLDASVKSRLQQIKNELSTK